MKCNTEIDRLSESNDANVSHGESLVKSVAGMLERQSLHCQEPKSIRRRCSMDRQALELEIKRTIVDALQLSDIKAESVESAAPLFGEGLGLDSIDALELAAALEGRFGIKFASASGELSTVFRSVSTLADFIVSARAGA